MANSPRAICKTGEGTFHLRSAWHGAMEMSLVAALSEGVCLRVATARRTQLYNLSIALVV